MATLLPLSGSDWDNALRAPLFETVDWESDDPNLVLISPEKAKSHFSHYFNSIDVSTLKSIRMLWPIPPAILPKEALWHVCAIRSRSGSYIQQIAVPSQAAEIDSFSRLLKERGYKAEPAIFTVQDGKTTLSTFSGETIDAEEIPLLADQKAQLHGSIEPSCLSWASKPEQLLFNAETSLQNIAMAGTIPFTHFSISEASFKQKPAISLENAEKIYLPRQFRDAGARLTDRGTILYDAMGASAMQKQRIDVVVAGFFDPGLLPIGSRLILAPKDLIQQISSSYEDMPKANGIEVRFLSEEKAPMIKEKIKQALIDAELSPYWNVETFREYEFTKDLLQQLSSERHLFTLLATIIILVACSNIISMLIILVNDKKLEIALLRALGATAGNIALIFGFCGIVMGVVGSAIGIGFAILTLKYLNTIVAFISKVQGYELFNAHFYGTRLPTDLSVDALFFVIVATAIISLLSGLIPAIKAACVKPSDALKSD
jgi:lipoprotein-releasing system permease protein